ncbi:hypothetical protein IE81DRAFT_333897 [Ceraceosorus guamensis]|uniref:Uncharacterized protein n=1 Tax=Ceraceosorus guamensis TaxID=1522189 RepID=A0A316W8M3_9BASI|nr:hypothetical protein IE81DRAFT_333897 [Ceraceosorus guamensis]PWN44045.1 hypothetical protein IE81DRAFT_333897 [Ceraceosorus guamensis]
MSRSLPTALKSLIKAPTFAARPSAVHTGKTLPPGRQSGPLAGPGDEKLNALFDKIDQEAKDRKVGWNEWGCFATATLVTLNASSSLAALHRHSVASPALRLSLEEKLNRAQLMRETGLKCIGFIGIPKVINNLAALRAAVEEDKELVQALPTEPRRKITPELLPRVEEAANALWDNIYTPHSSKLLKILGRSHPDLPVFIVDGEYGPLFSPPHTFAAPNPPPSLASSEEPPALEPVWEVGRLRTSLVAVASLRAQGGVGPQVTSHVWGLLKAASSLKNAETQLDNEEIGKRWLTTEEGALWVVRTVDGICEAVEGAEVAETASRESKL